MVAPIVHQHMFDTQATQSHHYNHSAQPWEFQPGNRVLLLVPTVNCKYFAHGQDPFIVAEHVRPVNSHLQQLGK